MSTRPQAPTHQPHSAEIRQVYERLLAGAPVSSRHVEVAGGRVYLLEHGAGPPVVVLHGTANPAGFLLPLLRELHGVQAIAPDRPGVGLSDPIDLPQDRYRETAVPKTRCPLPLRLATTPVVGRLLSRLAPPSPRSTLRFAHHVAREKETFARHPDLVDLLVAAGRDPITDHVSKAELRVFVSPFGVRRRSRVGPDELRRLAMPTLVVWGERDPVGSIPVARAVTELIPDARLEVLPTGHGPWLGQPARTAATVLELMR